MIPWVTAVVSGLGTTLHPAATCSVRAASALGPRWVLSSKDIPPRQDDSKKGEDLLRTALRGLYAFCVCCCGIKATVGHSIRSQSLHLFTLNRKRTKQNNLHLNTGFFVKTVTVTCFPLKWSYGSLTLTKYCKLLIVTSSFATMGNILLTCACV